MFFRSIRSALMIILFLHLITSAQAETISVDDDGSGADHSTIQEAIDNASAGDSIVVNSGLYNESLVIDKEIRLVGNGADNTEIRGVRNRDALIITGENVVLSGVRITGGRENHGSFAAVKVKASGCNISDVLCYEVAAGILINGSNNCTITDCMLFNTSYGIVVSSSDNIVLSGNTCYYTYFTGIEVLQSSFVSISDTICAGNGSYGQGIFVELSDNITISRNECSQFMFNGITIYEVRNALIERNLCENASDGIQMIRCDSFRVVENDCRSCEDGIFLSWSLFGTVADNICLENEKGIMLELSLNLTLEGNTCDGNQYGIYLDGDSPHNLVSENSCSLNKYKVWKETRGSGIYLGSVENVVVGNTCIGNFEGIGLLGRGNIVTNNTLSENWHGIRIDGDEVTGDIGDCVIRDNAISGNFHYGISSTDNYLDVIHAEENWWGDDSGPENDAHNPGGKGDRVGDNVDFSPWIVRTEDNGKEARKLPSNTLLIVIGVVTGGSLGLIYLARKREGLGVAILTWTMAPLYTRLQKRGVSQKLDKDTIRGMIYHAIKDNPGINYSGIRDSVEAGMGTTTYHLSVLQREGHIRTATNGNLRLFWSREAFPGVDWASITVLQQKILDTLEKNGIMTRSELSDRTGIALSTLHVNLKHLKERGLIESEKKGKNYFYGIKS